jgi:hypothetical protein
VTCPLNFYSQADFKSRDLVLAFHIGLITRVFSREQVPLTDSAAALLPRRNDPTPTLSARPPRQVVRRASLQRQRQQPPAGCS